MTSWIDLSHRQTRDYVKRLHNMYCFIIYFSKLIPRLHSTSARVSLLQQSALIVAILQTLWY